MLHKIKQNRTRFPNNKIIPLMIDQTRNPSIRIQLCKFYPSIILSQIKHTRTLMFRLAIKIQENTLIL